LFCIVPVILVAVFSWLTAARIRRSAGSISGEGAGQERLRHNRIVSSAVLTALAAVFVISYTPLFIYGFLCFQLNIMPMSVRQHLIVTVVTYYLTFLNCCFNHLVLLVMSKCFRDYAKEYICCGERN
jgi:hypothetical protein